MKKLAAWAMIFLMTLPISTMAEEVNLTDMTLDELLRLRKQIDHEILLRFEMEDIVSTLPKGEYVCGEHIKPGRYIFTNLALEKRGIRIYDNQEMHDQWEHRYYYLLTPNQSAFAELKEGMIVCLYDGDLLLEIANLPFQVQ